MNAPASQRQADLAAAYAMPVAAHALRPLTGLVNMRWQDMDAWSHAMIAGIDACITKRLSALRRTPDQRLLSVMLSAVLSGESLRANIKLSISGGQNEPRDAIAGAVWALLAHRDQLAGVLRGDVSRRRVSDEYVRWISPIAMSPRRVAQRCRAAASMA